MKRRNLLIAAFFVVPGCLVLLVAGALFLLHSPSLVNALAGSLEGRTGYRVHVRDIALGWRTGIDVQGLEVQDVKNHAFHLLLASAQVKGGLGSGLGLEVESIILTHPRFVFRVRRSEGQTNPFAALEKLPPVRLLVVQDGELELATETERFSLPGVHLTVKDFSPRTGGALKMEGSFNVATSGARAAGRFDGSFTMTRFSPAPSGTGSIDLIVDSASFGRVSLEKAHLASRVDLAGEQVAFQDVRVKAAAIASAGGQGGITASELEVRANLSYNQRTTRFSIAGLQGAGAGLGSFRAECSGAVSPLSWAGSAEVSSIDLPNIFSMVRPLIPREYRSWAFKGRGAVNVRSEGQAGDIPVWKADVRIDLKDGGFASPDNFKAGDRISGQIHLKMESPRKEGKGTFDLVASAGEGELLWGKYYRDFKGETVGVSMRGLFAPKPATLTCEGLLDLFRTGRYFFSGELSPEGTSLSVEGTDVSFESLFDVLLSDFVHQNYPDMGDVEIRGQSDFRISAYMSHGLLTAGGSIAIRGGAFNIPSADISMEGLQVSLPFDLTYPPPAAPSALTADQGTISVERIKGGGLETGQIRLPVLLSQNTLLVPVQVDLPLLGGTARLTHFRMDNLLAKARLDAGVAVDHLDLGLLTGNLASGPVSGAIDGALTSIRWEGDEWKTRGSIRASVFGGRIEVTDISARTPFARSRSVGADIIFEEIDLEQMTSKIEVGKMTGIVRGSLKDLVIDYGQPSRFILDIETDPGKKKPRAISVDAIENISILGTGSSAVSSILNSGVRRFFKTYPYSRIGIRCSLENDVFSLRGTVREGGKEYLVRRASLRGIDVVNQNPDNSISFKDMQERIGRIFRPKQGPKNVS